MSVFITDIIGIYQVLSDYGGSTRWVNRSSGVAVKSDAWLAVVFEGCSHPLEVHLMTGTLYLFCSSLQRLLSGQVPLFWGWLIVLNPSTSVVCQGFPVVVVQFQGLHILLADVFVSKLGSTFVSVPCGQFTIQLVFWNVAILHPMYVSKPS